MLYRGTFEGVWKNAVAQWTYGNTPKKKFVFTLEDKKYTFLSSNKEEINRIHFLAPF